MLRQGARVVHETGQIEAPAMRAPGTIPACEGTMRERLMSAVTFDPEHGGR